MRVRTGSNPALDTVRKGILGIVAFGIAGMTAELLLIGHYEDSSQLLPLAAAAIALVLMAAVWVWPSVALLRTLQFVMLTFIGTGVTGITLHFEASAEFQREIDPAISGMALVRKVMDATAPPLLAPGVMVQLGLLGLLYTYRHPVLDEGTFDDRRSGGD